MEGDEIEMCKEELQTWIREMVKKQLISTGLVEKCSLLESLLKRKKEQASKILKLCKSVAACEELLKKQYTLLGLEYKDTDSEDDDDKTKRVGNTSQPQIECVQLKNQAPASPTTIPLILKLEDSENLHFSGGKSFKRKPVVVLTRLSSCKRRSLRSPTAQSKISETESVSDVGSDPQWEPEDGSCDSDYSISSDNHRGKKRRKIDQRDKKCDARREKQNTRTSKVGKSSTKSTPQASKNSKAKDNVEKPSTSSAGPTVSKEITTERTSASSADETVNKKSNTKTTSISSADTNGETRSNKTSLNPSLAKASKTPASVPQVELSVDMDVLVRKKDINWLPAKILEIIPQGDRIRYKVCFKYKKKKKIVSAHHIAFACTPNVDQLSVGCRVVVKCAADPHMFSPGILAEVPCRRNRMRFLVFTDDHKASYVGLPQLHQVFRPLKNPLDDIPDGAHKDFIKEYLETWPHPHQTSYMIGQILHAEYEDVQQKCEVVEIDCSVIWVVFQKDKHKESMYRGSMRLQNMSRLKKH
ncbi:histone-lysine N-methyltransferase SETDB1-A [Notolabrus celidotus]|uniref:histone-lysine N-methyltransferase SETDB1-A n=1 Tax=Notolabrus celidotus TaxID=1203425 RepID=UPI00149086C1|nr:histone-lysine N-methyltransferase SETDB1-A [Notolabrus celidotus]